MEEEILNNLSTNPPDYEVGKNYPNPNGMECIFLGWDIITGLPCWKVNELTANRP